MVPTSFPTSRHKARVCLITQQGYFLIAVLWSACSTRREALKGESNGSRSRSGASRSVNWTWITWRALVPIVGPVVATALTLCVFGWLTKKDESLDKRFKGLWNLSAWLYYSVTTFAFSCFATLDSTEQRGLFCVGLVGLVISFFVHGAYTWQEQEDLQRRYDPPLQLRIVALVFAVAAAILGYSVAVTGSGTPVD